MNSKNKIKSFVLLFAAFAVLWSSTVFCESFVLENDVQYKDFVLESGLCLRIFADDEFIVIDSNGKELTAKLPYEGFETFYDSDEYSIIYFLDDTIETEPECMPLVASIYIAQTNYFSGYLYGEIRLFKNGYAAAEQLKDDKWGYLDQSGNLALPAIWCWAENFEDNGTALVTIETSVGYQNVVINRLGEIVSLTE